MYDISILDQKPWGSFKKFINKINLFLLIESTGPEGSREVGSESRRSPPVEDGYVNFNGRRLRVPPGGKIHRMHNKAYIPDGNWKNKITSLSILYTVDSYKRPFPGKCLSLPLTLHSVSALLVA